jgi:hypothetical protein
MSAKTQYNEVNSDILSESEEETNPEKVIQKSELGDKHKETYENLITEYVKYKNKINKAYTLLSSQLIEIKKFEKNIDIVVNKMIKLHEKNSNKKPSVKKENTNCGFNKEVPVPPVLIDFLELKETVLTRPKVGSLLTKKFKELGLKTGQYIQLDEDTINQLGLDETYLEPIKQTYFQTLLATFYKK